MLPALKRVRSRNSLAYPGISDVVAVIGSESKFLKIQQLEMNSITKVIEIKDQIHFKN